MATDSQLEYGIARSDGVGLLLYAATLIGEVISAVLRGYLVGAVVAAVLLVLGDNTRDAVPVGVVAGALPLVWSITAVF